MADDARTAEPDGDPTLAELAHCELVFDRPADELRQLADVLTPLAVAAGTVLMRPGDAADRLLFVTHGSVGVALDREPPGPHEFVVPEGSVVGELAVLLGTPHRATVTARTDVRCLLGGRLAVDRLLGSSVVRDRLVRLARHRLAADLDPVPLRLRDGSRVWLRPVVPEDGLAVQRDPDRSSGETLYRRFFRPGLPSGRELAYLADADYVDHFAWAAIDDAGVPVGEASYFRTAETRTEAEVSFWLADDLQHRGLGTLMLGALAVAARRNGVVRFVADVLDANTPARALLDRAGAQWASRPFGVVHGTTGVPEPGALGISAHTSAALDALVDALVRCGSRRVTSS